MMHRPLRGVLAGSVLVLAVFPCLAHPTASGPVSSGDERGQAYYLFSLSQQAQYERDYTGALKYLEEAVRADDSPELRIELAELYASLSQNDAAEEEVRKVLARDPSSVDGRRLLAQVLLNQPPEREGRENRLRESEKIYRDLLDEGKADPTSVLALAGLQMDRGDAAAARATLEAYRSSHAVSSPVDLHLARIYQQSGLGEDAIALLRGVVAREKDNREARNALGASLEEAGRHDEAARVYQDIVDQTPNNPYGHYRLAGALLALKRYREAQAHLTTALRGDPRNVRVLMALGQAYEGTGETGLAEGAYRKALERDPASMEARFFLARIHQGRGEDDEALGLYREILSRNSAPESPSERALFVVTCTQVGVIQLLQKKYPAAIQSLGQAYQASGNPGPDLYALLGRTHIEAGQLEEAGKVLSEGRKKYPDDLGLAAMEGEILLRESRPEQAREVFRGLLDLSEGSEGAYLEVLQSYLGAERLQDAAPWMREAVRKHPGSRDLEFQAAALEERLGRYREAEKRFRELIRKRPEDAEALNYLGYMLADHGVQLEDSLRLLEKAVSLDPENGAYLDSLGWVHYRLGRLDRAEAFLEKAVRGSRSDPAILEHLGDVHAALGRASEALDAYRKSLERGAEKPEEILRKIRKLETGPVGP